MHLGLGSPFFLVAALSLWNGATANAQTGHEGHRPMRKHHHHHHDRIYSTVDMTPLSSALPLGRKKSDGASARGHSDDEDYSYQHPSSKHTKYGHGTDQHRHGSKSQDRLDQLIADKLVGYEKLARPIPDCSTFDCSHRIKVFMGLSFQKLIELNQAEGSLALVVWLRLTWPDYRLRYNASEYFRDVPAFGQGEKFNWDSDLDSIPLSQQVVWKPDVQLVNAIKEPEDINTSPRVFWYDEQKLRTKGYNMMLVAPQIVHVNCPVSLAEFPFDTQTCQLEFGDWSASEQYFEFDTIDRAATEMPMSEANQDFLVEKVTVKRAKKAYSSLETTRFPEIIYSLSLKRYPNYYLLHFVLPQLLLVLLGQGIYWMSIEGERLSTGITVILAVMTVSFLTAPMLPETNEVMWLERFQVGCYILTCIPVFVSMLLDHANHMQICASIWIDHADNLCRLTHPLLVLVFFLYMFGHITWPKDQPEVQGLLIFNVVVYIVFAVAGILNTCQFCGRLRRDANKLTVNNTALAYKRKADEDLDELEAQDESGHAAGSTSTNIPPQVSAAELREAVEGLRRALEGGVGSSSVR